MLNEFGIDKMAKLEKNKQDTVFVIFSNPVCTNLTLHI